MNIKPEMREFKFRAWDKEHGMGEVVGWSRSIIDIAYPIGWKTEAGHPVSAVGARLRGGVALMQFTGLRDKNGKEIYEGDIVKDGKNVGIIKYGAGTFDAGIYNFIGFYIDFDDGRQEEGRGSGYENWWELNLKKPFEGEVIGNIYENPDLLEQA